MSGPEFAFAGFGIMAAVGGVAVVASRNVVHAALYLVVVLASVGAVFLVLGAEFLGWTQVLIYVGAIVVLLLFGLMLTRAPIGREALDNEQRPLAFVCAAGTFGVLTWLIWRTFDGQRIALTGPTTSEQVGEGIFTRFVLPFELVSVLLLAALVGAIVLAKRD